jgi:hypothetical protein
MPSCYNSDMTQENEKKHILNFPYQLASAEEMQDCYDIDVLGFQTRLLGIKLISAIQSGEVQRTENVLQTLKKLNASLTEMGKPELPLDFLN